jgi:hypothetical protein
VVVNHIPWMRNRSPTLPSLDELLAWGVDYVEVLNGGDFDLQSYEYCKDYGMGVISGTDMHTPETIYGWTTLNVTGMVENPEFTLLKPLIYLWRMFRNYDPGNDKYDWFGIAVLGMYLFGAFAISEFIRFGYRKLKVRLGRNPNPSLPK